MKEPIDQLIQLTKSVRAGILQDNFSNFVSVPAPLFTIKKMKEYFELKTKDDFLLALDFAIRNVVSKRYLQQERRLHFHEYYMVGKNRRILLR
ncbi:hypothetical protein [Agaribacterium haliotis]|uniref:hypothetical protein n=1 Tax=Agaribacterium haliotis TaxID=2013869 RepID=UPI00117824CA|nr:hypothetical protein [Agaribacterium haliotis]